MIRRVTVRVETSYFTGELLQIALIRCVYHAAMDRLHYAVKSIQLITELDPQDVSKWSNPRNYAVVQFEIPEESDFDPTLLQGEGHEIVTLVSDFTTPQ